MYELYKVFSILILLHLLGLASLTSGVQEKPRVFVEVKHNDAVLSVAFSSDGKFIALGSRNGIVKIWDITTVKEIRTLTNRGIVNSLAFFLDGKLIATGGCDNIIRIWDMATGEDVKLVSGYGKSTGVPMFALSPDSRFIASIGLGKLKKIEIRDTVTFNKVKTLEPIVSAPIFFSPDGKLIISKSPSECKIKIIDVSTGKEIKTLEGNSIIYSIAISPDGRLVASGDNDGIKIWDVTTGNKIRTIKKESSSELIYTIVFSTDSKFLISSGSDNTVKIWDVSTGEKIRVLAGHNDWVVSLAVSPNGKVLSSGSLDGTMRLWDLQSGKEIVTFIVYSDNEWVVMTSEGYYVSSPEGWKHIKIQIGKKVHDIEENYKAFYRPDIVQHDLICVFSTN